jgi:hypothetical protein
MNVEMGAEAAQFPQKEYIKGIAVAVCYLSRAGGFKTWGNTTGKWRKWRKKSRKSILTSRI